MAKMQIKFELEGEDEFRRQVTALGGRKMKAILRNATTYGITPMLSAAKRMVPRDTGQLKLSISKVVRTYPSGVTVGVVGPAGGFRGHFMNKRGQLVLRNPVKYAHLVEYGHRVARGGKLARSRISSAVIKPEHYGTVIGIASPRPFMGPAFIATEAQVRSRMAQSIATGLAKAGVE